MRGCVYICLYVYAAVNLSGFFHRSICVAEKMSFEIMRCTFLDDVDSLEFYSEPKIVGVELEFSFPSLFFLIN